MGSVKLLKGSEEFEMFQDYWKMMQSVWSVENTKEYWEKVVEDTDRFYRKYQMSTGINGYGNGTMTREEHQETERSVLSSLVVAMSGIQKLIGEYASLEEDGLLPEMAAEEIMQINAESVDQYEAIQKAFRLGMEKAKSENVVRTSGIWIRGHGRVETVRFDRSGRLHDKRPGDRRKGRSSLHDVPERRREVYYYQAHYNKLIFHL